MHERHRSASRFGNQPRALQWGLVFQGIASVSVEFSEGAVSGVPSVTGAWPVIVRRAGRGPQAEALDRGPGVHQRAVDREMDVRRKWRDCPMGQNHRLHLE